MYWTNHDPVTGETYYNGRWWQPEETNKLAQEKERHQEEHLAHKEDNEKE